MTIFSLYITSKAGSLIYQYDHNSPDVQVEKTFSFPLQVKLEFQNKNIVIVFGQSDGLKVGHTLMAVNGIDVTMRQLDDGRDVFDVLENEENYPINLKFGRPKLNTNEKIVLASMFHSWFIIASQLSPELHSSGIQTMDTDTFKLHCFQTLTGIKFIIVADPKEGNIDILLRKIYELYSDFALKSPFYSLDMPIRDNSGHVKKNTKEDIYSGHSTSYHTATELTRHRFCPIFYRCELFDTNLQNVLEQSEKLGISNI